MIATIASGILVITFTVAVMAVVMAVVSTRSRSAATLESARRAALITFPLLSLVLAGLLTLLVSGRFEYAYVYQTTDAAMPLYLKLAAVWGGQEGSLLFWTWLLSGFTFIALLRTRSSERDLVPWVIVVTSITLAFFLFLVLFFENPFFRFFITMQGDVVRSLFRPIHTLQATPDFGLGMNPLLRHPGMVVHPPMLYLGFVGFVIPFAYAIAALAAGRHDSAWLRATRKWSLAAWLFLTIGLVLGSRWAYDVLGWGGYWGWDPVEVSALMPWLTGTAYLHSSLVQEKRGIFKRWNIALIILTFCLVIVGTFLTRSGMLSSVHAFSQSAIGPSFFVFTAVVLVVSLVLLGYRWAGLRGGFQINSYFSRETLFLFNNLLFVAIFLICFVGVLFPVFSELITGQQVTVGPPFYRRATGPLFAGLLLLMGVVPLSAWSASTGRRLGRHIWKPAVVSLAAPLAALLAGSREWGALLAFWVVTLSILVTLYDYGRSVLIHARVNQVSPWQSFQRLTSHNRRRYGAYIIHLGVALMGLGIIGIEFFQTQTQATVRQGESITLAGYTLNYRDLKIDDALMDREVARAEIQVTRNGREMTWLYPSRDYYYTAQQSVTTPGLRSTLLDDLYVVLVDWMPVTSEGATFKVYRNPLVIWLWIGTLVLILGTLLALWPARRSTREVEAA